MGGEQEFSAHAVATVIPPTVIENEEASEDES